ncbi:MAG: hypothetical protein ISR65_19525 [Bacteriovoracaceae bacterium]|nr:hypothetical protein [Bacteriovoracaceae bacterium]
MKALVLKVITTTLFLGITSSVFSTTQDEKNLMQLLRIHTDHTLHVRYLGAALLEISDQFRGVDKQVLDRYLYLHETAKTNFLLGNAQKDSSTNMAIMHKESEDGLLASFREADKESTTAFFRSEGLIGNNESLADSSLVQKYLRIERIANVVERGHSQTVGLGFKKDMLPGYAYFDQVKNDTDAARLALRLEHEYYKAPTVDGGSTKLIRTYDEYRLHNFTHIVRVTRLGKFLLKAEPEKFREVDPKILEEFLLLHNQSKINQSPEFIKQHGLQSVESMSSRLYLNFSLDFNTLSDGLKREGKEFVDQLNQIDREVAIAFFRKKGLLGKDELVEDNPLVQLYLAIEKVADAVDGSKDPVFEEEYGRKMSPAHLYLLKTNPDPSIAMHAAVLDINYDDIIRGDSYRSHAPLLRLALKKHAWDETKKRFVRRKGLCMQIMTEFFLGNNFPSLSVR